MTEKNDGGAAFPGIGRSMTLRDYFAIHGPASEDGLSTPSTVLECEEYLGLGKGEYSWKRDWNKVVAKARYEFADAMLAARGIK